MPGVNNNLGATPEGDAEYATRNEANLEWMREGFDYALTDQSSAVMILIQANPGFELPGEERTGYNDFLAALEEETVAFGKPVVLVHGDTHIFPHAYPPTRLARIGGTGRRAGGRSPSLSSNASARLMTLALPL